MKNIKIDFKQAAIEQIPFPDNYFNVVASSWVIHQLNISNKLKAFNEILRILKSNGHFLLVDLHRIENPFKAFFSLPFYWWNKAYKIHVIGQLPELMSKSGFIKMKIVNRLDDRIEYISAIKQ